MSQDSNRWTFDSMKCYFCGESVRAHEAGTYRLIEGWGEVRRAGGFNTLVMASPPKAFAHKHCVENKRHFAKQDEFKW